MLRLAVILLLVCATCLPHANAQTSETLASLEEPHEGSDRVWDITVTEDEADEDRILIYRNQVGKRFNVSITNAEGKEIFTKRGDRGVQTLPGLPAGQYKFFVRGTGAFQVTDKGFGKTIPEGNVSANLSGTDAYVLTSQKYYNVSFTGNVSVEWLSLVSSPDGFEAPGMRLAQAGLPYIITLRGNEDAPYTISFDLAPAPPTVEKDTPAPGMALVVFAALGGAFLLRRRT